jgi:fibronectin-binding autotransporter adhesin
VTISGNTFGGTNDSGGAFIYAPNGAPTITFTGVQYGVFNSNVTVFANYVQSGFSPTSSNSLGGSAASLALTADTPNQPAKTLATNGIHGPAFTYSGGQGYGTVIIYSYTGHPSTGYQVTGSITVGGDSGTPYNAAVGDTFYLVRSDAHLWPGTGISGYFTDGSVTGTLPSISLGSNFTNTSGYAQNSSILTGTGGFIRLWFGNVMPQGSGTWLNAGGTGNWSTNPNSGTFSTNASGSYPTSYTGSWGAAGGVTNGSTAVFGKPGAAGDIATFDNSIASANYNNGVVNVDIPVTIGGMVLKSSGQTGGPGGLGGYSIGGATASTITLDNGSLNSLISVTGTQAITSPLSVVGAGLSVTFNTSSDQLSIAGGITATGNSTYTNAAKGLTLTGASGGVLILGGTNQFAGTVGLTGGAQLLVQSGTLSAGTVSVASGSTLGGSGAISVSSATTIAGTLLIQLQTAGSGGASATANSGYSTSNGGVIGQLLVSGSLTFNGSTPITIASLTGSGFNSSQDYSWLIGTATSPITGAPSAPSSVSGTDFTGSASGFSIGTSGTNMYLNYAPASVPEPEHVLLLSVGALLAGLALRWRFTNNLCTDAI